MFRASIEKDPQFALAYVGLADTLAIRSGFIEAEGVVKRALSLDPNLAEAHATRGFIDIFYRWNWAEAEEELDRSVELNPSYGSAHQWLGILFEIEGKRAEGIRELDRAIEIDPSSPNFEADLGQAYYFDHEYDKAKYHCQKALEFDPDFAFAHGYLINIGLITGDYITVMDEWQASGRLNEAYPTQSDAEKQRIAEKYLALAAGFKDAPPSKFLDSLIDENASTPETCWRNAQIYALRGDRKNALSNLVCAARTKNFGSAFINADPMFDNLRDDANFKEILQKMSLPR